MNQKESRSLEEFKERLAKLSEEQIAWFSGWLCADGTILKTDTGLPRVRFNISDKDPLDKFSELLGCKVHGPIKPSGLGKKPIWEWAVTGMKALMLLKRCEKWLSERYKMRFLACRQTNNPRSKLLSNEDAKFIKSAVKTAKHGDLRRLARRFGVSEATISAIKAGRIYNWL